MFENATYLISAADLHQLPPDSRRRGGVCGALECRQVERDQCHLRTSQACLYQPHARPHANDQLLFALPNGTRLVDLPGYGYAKVPAAIRDRWEALIAGYLQVRRSLRGLVVIMDARHPLMALDKQMLEWFSGAYKPVEVLLTKADKLSRQAARRQLTQTRALLAQTYPTARVQLFSSVTGEGVEEARQALQHLVGHSETTNMLRTEAESKRLELRRPKENPRQRG